MKLPTPPGIDWPPYLPPELRQHTFAIIYKAVLKELATLEIIAEDRGVYTLKITWPKGLYECKPSRALYYLRPE